jgi:hypothetical protein
MLTLALSSISLPLFPLVKAANVEITSITPSSKEGYVGDKVQVVGTVNASSDNYQIVLRNNVTEYIVVNATSASGTKVNATFSIPYLPGGNYTLVLQDTNKSVNATSWLYIETAYSVEAKDTTTHKALESPAQWQEGDSVEIWINTTGAKASWEYAANITIKLPSPKNTTYWVTRKYNTTSAGNFSGFLVSYPNVTAFNGTTTIPANTNYTGTYTLALNKTSSKTLATSTFKIGLTNATQYHRQQYVDVRAKGYKTNENVLVKILYGTKIMKNETVTANATGFVVANWTVFSNASIGVYTLNITSTRIGSTKTTKNPSDLQDFTVPGFGVNITAKNLAGESVPNIVIKVFEDNTKAANGTSNSSGLVKATLEIGIYYCNATYRNRKVGERTINVTGAASFDLNCSLTNLGISVFSEDGVRIPEVEIFLSPENQTLTTDINGAAIAHSLLPVWINTSQPYVLNASRYGISFNVTKIPTLFVNATPVAWYNVTIFCPTLKLQITTLNAVGKPITDVTIKVQELTGGLYNESATDSDGKVAFSFIFGKYLVGVYDADGIELNETTVSLFEDENVSIVCKLYGLTVSVEVVDYLGQPISGADVILQREGMTTRSDQTQSNGTVTFSSVTGGTFYVTVYLFDQKEPTSEGSYSVEENTTIVIKVDEYLMLIGMPVETSTFAIALIIVLTLVFILAVEIYRKRRFKQQKNTNLTENK